MDHLEKRQVGRPSVNLELADGRPSRKTWYEPSTKKNLILEKIPLDPCGKLDLAADPSGELVFFVPRTIAIS
jgi:hypothetical protein